MLGLQPQSQQTRCIFQLYPNGRASYHAHHRARPHTRKSIRPDTPSTRPKHFLAKNERLVTPPLGKRGCAPSTALVTTPVIPATERPHPRSPGRSVTNLSFLAKIAMRRTRQAERYRPGPSQSPSKCGGQSDAVQSSLRFPHPPSPAHAPNKKGERRRLVSSHPSAQRTRRRREAPGLPSSDSAGAAAARENRRRRFPGGGHAPRTSEGESRGLPG